MAVLSGFLQAPKSMYSTMCFHYELLTMSRLLITHQADPQLTPHQVTLKAKKEFRIKHKLDAPGKAKRAMTTNQLDAQKKYVQKALDAHQLAVSRSIEDTETESSTDQISFFSSDIPSSPAPPPSSPNTTPSTLPTLNLPYLPPLPKRQRLNADRHLAKAASIETLDSVQNVSIRSTRSKRKIH
jgi:hypothetical protein